MILFKRLFAALSSSTLAGEEYSLHRLFGEDPVIGAHLLAKFYNEAPMFKRSLSLGGIYVSPLGYVRVEKDIYGPEVKVNGNSELLDCCPSAYGLTKAQATELYEAILSCVPGTVNAEEKVKRNQEKRA